MPLTGKPSRPCRTDLTHTSLVVNSERLPPVPVDTVPLMSDPNTLAATIFSSSLLHTC